jgi:CSLREA domain-containing protein
MKCTNGIKRSVASRLSMWMILFLALAIPAKVLSQDTSMTFVVNVTGDDDDPNAGMPGHKCDTTVPGDQCSLRAAIENHNGNRELPLNHIRFAIPNAPGSGSIVIKVGSTGLGPLPPILGAVTIFALNADGRRIEIDGSMAGPNAIGLQLLGGPCQISFFVINSFSSHGIYISGTPPPGDGGHQIESNYIGTDSTGTVGKGNGGDGIFVENTPNNTIGGTGVRRNIISANKGYGIRILGFDSTTFLPNGAKNNLVQANIIGLDLSGQNSLPNGMDAVLLNNAPNNTIGGTGPNQGNTMGGTKNGVTIIGSLSQGIKIQGNFIGVDGTGAKFSAGIFSRGGNQLSVEGNFLTNIDSVGVDLFANADGNYNFLKNRFDGDMQIGGKFRFGPGQQVNITYQNNFHLSNGMAIDAQESLGGTINWILLGDTIRAGQTGANMIFASAGNKNFTSNRWEGTAGVGFNYAANIGPGVQASLTQQSEVFANNGQQGVYGKITAGGQLAISMADISGNQNGKDACRLEFVMSAGASAVFNSTRNRYTANGSVGLRLLSDGNNIDLIQAFIERDIMDGNTLGGINILNMKLRHTIANSTITNNGGPGILIDGNSDVGIDSNTISGNTVGILVDGAATGGISANTVTGNATGIGLAGTGTGVDISDNIIFNNTGLGIDLGNDGVTPNHLGFEAGPDNFQNHPVLTNAKVLGGNTIVAGTMNSLANSTYRMEFFSNNACNPLGFGDGQNFLGSMQITTDATGNANFTDTLVGVVVPANAAITSTATDSAGNSSEFSACVLSTPLPLELLDFTAATNGSHITLNWTTANEKNTEYFAIERSPDGNTFTDHGQVQVSDNSSGQTNYVFVDQWPLAGSNFYRLRMVDLDGSVSYSRIVAVMMGSSPNTLSVFPNPAFKELTVKLSATGPVQLRLADVNGRILKEEVIELSGNISANLDIGELPAGVYILILQDSRILQYRKFIKQ